jgi:hypothetical protein
LGDAGGGGGENALPIFFLPNNNNNIFLRGAELNRGEKIEIFLKGLFEWCKDR